MLGRIADVFLGFGIVGIGGLRLGFYRAWIYCLALPTDLLLLL